MDLQEKLLNLQLLESRVKEYPARLYNSLKFSLAFDKEYTPKNIEEMKKGLREVRVSLEQLQKQDQSIRAVKDEAVALANGNRKFFDDLMTQYGITEEEISDIIGDAPDRGSPVPREAATSDDGEDLQDDDEELSYEIRKTNLTEIRKYSTKNSIED